MVSSNTTGSSSGDNRLYIGARAEGYGYGGIIDEVSIYSSAPTSQQIQRLYAHSLKKLLAQGSISQEEYGLRIKELGKQMVRKE